MANRGIDAAPIAFTNGFAWNLRTYCAVSAVGGAVVWVLRTAWMQPSPFDPGWAVALLLLGPLVLVPLGLRLVANVDRNAGVDSSLLRTAALLQLPAALALVASFEIPTGQMAAVLALPWLGVTGLIALFGINRVRLRGRRLVGELAIDAALMFLVVGGGWAVLSRYGARPLGFKPIIVLLTAIHFHFAGFVLPLVTGLAARRSIGWTAGLASIGVILGVPLVAIGITATQLGFAGFWESLAACWLATAGMLTAWLHLQLAVGWHWRPAECRLAGRLSGGRQCEYNAETSTGGQATRGTRRGTPVVRALWLITGLSLAASMVLAVLYGLRFMGVAPSLDIPTMRAWHGTANALGFALPAAIAWNLTTVTPSSRAVSARPARDPVRGRWGRSGGRS